LLEGCPIVVPRTATAALIPTRLLIASGPFGESMPAARAAAAIARGVVAGGLPEPELCAIEDPAAGAGEVRELLDALGFDVRMRRARAVVIGAERLQERALAGSLTFELATRARQAGVPAYAVTGENALEPFDARMLDLQLILQARGTRALVAAGRRLAGLV
jgi:glycerate kinase